MNKQDIKLANIRNGFYKYNERTLISVSLDLNTFQQLKVLRKKYRLMLNDYLNNWIEQLPIINHIKNCKNDKIDIMHKTYPHESFKFNSFYILTKNKIKLKTIAAINDVSASSLIRQFIWNLEKK